MLDFFRDLYLEAHGIDSIEAAKERKIVRQKKRREYILFSPRTKVIIGIMAVIFVLMQLSQITMIAEKGIGYLLFTTALCFLAIIAVILLLVKNKKAELAGAILIGIFVISEYIFTMLILLG